MKTLFKTYIDSKNGLSIGATIRYTDAKTVELTFVEGKLINDNGYNIFEFSPYEARIKRYTLATLSRFSQKKVDEATKDGIFMIDSFNITNFSI